jgi:hypothetical protein
MKGVPLVEQVFEDAEGNNVTHDLKLDPATAVGTSQVADAVIAKLKR